MMLLVVLYGLAASAEGLPTPSTPKCERAPVHAQPADRYYNLSIAGDPDLFLPGELYTVSLQGVDGGEGPTPFTAFTIWAEIYEQIEEKDSKDIIGSDKPKNQSLGTFQAYDAQTKLFEDCKPSIGNATAHPKTEIQVIWTAPSNADGGCVRLCARAYRSKHENGAEEGSVWSVLARKMCPAPAATDGAHRHALIMEPCCACDEAKYEVTFEGLWSRNTHPREFPPEAARAHFGDVIGASHTAQYRVWQEGRVASAGLSRLADDGATTALEKELKEESDHIRTIIKARGISWQQVSAGGIPSTFAVFRADAKHHLMSLAAKLAPSPDWIVGVSALELCNANCTWTRSATLPLYPFDAGTDSGLSYTARRQPTNPPAPVRALRPDWPRDPRSPFYNVAGGEMRPFARLKLTRLRLYEKSCEPSEPSREPLPETGGGSCATQSWGAWGPCSVTCGNGRATRQRHYLWPVRALTDGCRAQLTESRDCQGPRAFCRVVSEYEVDPAESSGPCAVSEWSDWSPCDGCGVRARTRHYIAPRARKRCHVGFRARTVMSLAMPCAAGPCNKPPGKYANSTNFDWFFVDNPIRECKMTAWGDWSPCSATCGRGRRLRGRLYVARDSRVQEQLTLRILHAWNQRFAELQDMDLTPYNTTNVDPEVEKMVQDHLKLCELSLTQQEALCDGEGKCQDSNQKESCSLPPLVGHCRGYRERWFYDVSSGLCEPFGYTGCGGNANNFPNRESCLKHCQLTPNVTAVTSSTPTPETILKKLKPTPSHEDNEVMQSDLSRTRLLAEDMDCKTGPWLGWSDCTGDCDYAVKLNYRHIAEAGSGLGKSCQKIIKSRNCRPGRCRKLFAFTNNSLKIKYSIL